MIIHRESLFAKLGEKVIRYDEQDVRDSPAGDDEALCLRRRGGTRSTRNIGLFVALSHKDRPSGCIVGTTHLFWHPKAKYERTRSVFLASPLTLLVLTRH